MFCRLVRMSVAVLLTLSVVRAFAGEKRGHGPSGRVDGPKGNLSDFAYRSLVRPGTPEPQPWGAVTRRAVAQRRSRASGLTRLSA